MFVTIEPESLHLCNNFSSLLFNCFLKSTGRKTIDRIYPYFEYVFKKQHTIVFQGVERKKDHWRRFIGPHEMPMLVVR